MSQGTLLEQGSWTRWSFPTLLILCYNSWPKNVLTPGRGVGTKHICFHWNCSSGFKSEFKLRIPPLEYSQDRQHCYCQPQSKQLAHSSRAYLCTSYFGTLYSPCLSVDPAVILQFVFEEIERRSLTSLDQIFNRNSC